MAPETRSGGAPPEGRVYHSSPSLRQAHFPPRRRIVRTYGKQPKRKENASLKQQTLTQIDFVSSFSEDPVVLSDSEPDDVGEGDRSPGNNNVIEDRPEARKDHGRVDDESDPKPTEPKRRTRPKVEEVRKRRRRLSDDADKPPAKQDVAARRRTMGDSPTLSRYYTQTLTQFLCQDSIANSDSDTDNDAGFLDWLGPQDNPIYETMQQPPAASKDNSPSPESMGDSPTSSRYHTKPLTQLLGRDSIANSDSDTDSDAGFLDWLGHETMQQRPAASKGSSPSPESMGDSNGVAESCPLREESVIPQTPVKSTRNNAGTRSPGRQSTPISSHIARYGLPDRQVSPLKGAASLNTAPLPAELTGNPKQCGGRPPVLIVEDSFATESWSSRTETPTRHSLRQSQPRVSQAPKSPSPTHKISAVESPRRGSPSQLTHDSKSAERKSEGREAPGKKTKTPAPSQQGSHPKPSIRLREIADSDEEENEEFPDENPEWEDEFVAGAETQLVLEELASLEHKLDNRTTTTCRSLISTSVSRSQVAPKTAPDTRPTSTTRPRKPLKVLPFPSTHPNMKLGHGRRDRPLRSPHHRPTSGRVQPATQLLESQRVPLHILQAFPSASARTDILLPLPLEILDPMLGGYEIHLRLPYKIPKQVVRFWLYDGSVLRYMACVEPGEGSGAEWAYHVNQVYELNNPVEGEDIQEEGWVNGEIRRYVYLPPAVVGQLLWNLRHALFGHDSQPPDKGHAEPEELHRGGRGRMNGPSQDHVSAASPTASQQVSAQIAGDLSHSTQLSPSDNIPGASLATNQSVQENPEPLPASRSHSHSPRDRPAPPRSTTWPRPSQATTNSQASTPEQQPAASPRQVHHDEPCSSSSLTFQDHGSSAVVVPNSIAQFHSSQLLTKSQMLPDSLVRDGPGLPHEIWDSEDEDGDAF